MYYVETHFVFVYCSRSVWNDLYNMNLYVCHIDEHVDMQVGMHIHPKIKTKTTMLAFIQQCLFVSVWA